MKKPNWESLNSLQLNEIAKAYVDYLNYLIKNSSNNNLVEKSKNELEEVNNLINASSND
jgi:hypothetical protein